MLECRACFRRFLRTLNSSNELNTSTTLATPAQKRSLSTVQRTSKLRFTKSERSAPSRDRPQPSQKWVDSPQAQARRRDIRKETRTTKSEHEHRARVFTGQATRRLHRPLETDNSKDQEKKPLLTPEEEKAEREIKDLKIELRWLRDPLKLSQHVEKLLQKQNWDKALALVRLSNRGSVYTVAWNHLLNYQMKTGQVRAAVKLFNEMKKRAQKPDSHTFTILFRGLADHAHHPNALGTALQLYHSMSAENSNVQANIIHTNSLLKICSRVGDLDSMWDIASKLPERGSYAANSWTFTTFLQTMREQAILSSKGTNTEAAALKREEMIVEGRKLWAVIVTRWRQGEIMLDEELVCAMGRLLLTGGRPRDWDDVLSLLQQSMAIPRQVPALGTQARKDEGQVRIRTKPLPQGLRATEMGETDEEAGVRFGVEFDDSFGLKEGQKAPSSSSLARARSRGTSSYAEPGNNTLSLILEATLKTVAVDAGLSYWRLLTSPDGQYVVVPDLDNIHMLLRLLRQSRDSTAAAKILTHDMRELRMPYQSKTFRIAMSACVRDANNEKVMANADAILDVMIAKSSGDADLNVLVQYIDVVNKSAEHAAKNAKSAEKQGAVKFNVPTVVRAIERLTPFAFDAIKRAKAGLKAGSAAEIGDEAASATSETPATTGKLHKGQEISIKASDDRATIAELERSLIRLHDRVIDAVQTARAASKGSESAPWGVTAETIERYKKRSGRLTGAVTKESNRRNAKDMEARELRKRNSEKARERRALEGKTRGDVPKVEVVEDMAVTENESKIEEAEEEEEDPFKRKWTPGVKPRSGIARAFATS